MDDRKSKPQPDTLLLLRACEADDRAAFERIYLKYYPILLTYFARGKYRQHVREELAQEVFRRAWQHRRRCQDYPRVSAFLMAIAQNVGREIHKDHRMRIDCSRLAEGDLEKSAITDVTPDLIVQERETRTRVRQGIASLPAKQREAAELVYIEGYSPKEAAERITCSIFLFHERLRGARNQLQKWLKA